MSKKTLESNQHEDSISSEETLSRRAQIIRSKLVNVLDSCDLLPAREEHKDGPKHSVKDVTDLKRYTSLEKESNHLVKFAINHPRRDIITQEQHRLNRVLNRHSKYPPLNMFAHWVLESSVFNALMVFLVVLNITLLAIEAEYHDYKDPSVDIILMVLKLLNGSILQVYILEIILKWVDDFWMFWQNTWNVFDFAVTLMMVCLSMCICDISSFQCYSGQIVRMVYTLGLTLHPVEPILPAIVPETFRGAVISQKFLKLLVQFRVIRCLKIISRFKNIRLMLQIIYRACGTVKFIFPVLLMSFLVFAVFGVVLFEEYTNSNVEGLLYKNDFKDLSSAFITLFSIFTLEHWLDLLRAIQKVPELNHNLCGFYTMAWFLFGALMACAFITLLIADFQEVRNNLSKEVQQMNILRRAEMFKASQMGTTNPKDHKPDKDEEEQPSPNVSLDSHTSRHEMDWDIGLEAFIKAAEIEDSCETECWHEDNLHNYLQLMEKLQCNIEEIDRLQDILDQGLLNLYEC